MAERDPQDVQARREAEAAAHEAAGIGGRAPDDEDPARRPVDEAGGGEAEGFELAEEELIEHATHGDPGPDPTHMAGEEEESEAALEYAEADEIRSSELNPDERTD